MILTSSEFGFCFPFSAAKNGGFPFRSNRNHPGQRHPPPPSSCFREINGLFLFFLDMASTRRGKALPIIFLLAVLWWLFLSFPDNDAGRLVFLSLLSRPVNGNGCFFPLTIADAASRRIGSSS